ncbi:hypothetical protein OBV_25850 [Oscillibacter valericigenes Sjm18-20]|nr:hypothetical protein OBV_25850 [Oscillibacter valericigenes Sjm18-20]
MRLIDGTKHNNPRVLSAAGYEPLFLQQSYFSAIFAAFIDINTLKHLISMGNEVF